MRLACSLLLATFAAPAFADTPDPGPPSSWPRWDDAKLGVHVAHPAAAKVSAKSDTIVVAGKDLPTVTIVVSTTTERGRDRNGGVSANHVEYTIDVPERHAVCTADEADPDRSNVAVEICDALVVDPGPRHPHVELTVTSKGLADADAYEKAVRAKQPQLDDCWVKALAKDKDLPEGSIALRRTFDHGAPAATSQHLENFFDHDAKALGACVASIVKAVPAKTADDAAQIDVEAICQLY
jgi:hypothetical protein